MTSTPPVIDSPQQWEHLERSLATVTDLAFDLESNSMFAYKPQVCVVQLAWEQDGTTQVAVVDTLALGTRPLGPILESPTVRKVIHDVSFDARLLADEGVRVDNVFDTSLAANLLGFQKTGLQSMLRDHLGVDVSKEMQLSDWAKRPLELDSLQYLVQDVLHLLPLARVLEERLRRAGLLDELRVDTALRLREAWNGTADDRSPGEKVKRAGGLSFRQRAVLHSLAEARERIAQLVDRPPQVLINDRALVAMARRPPRNLSELRRWSKSLRRVPKAYWQDLVRASHVVSEEVSQGSERRPDPSPPRPRTTPVEVSEASSVLKKRLERWREEEAARRGVSVQAVLPTRCLKKLLSGEIRQRRQLEQLPGLGASRLERYGDVLIQMVQEAFGSVRP